MMAANNRRRSLRLQNDDELFMGNPREAYYSGAWRQWLDVLPAAQLLPVQYEELVAEATQGRELRRIKEFIGVDVEGLPDALNWDDFNCRHCRIKPEGACVCSVVQLMEESASHPTFSSVWRKSATSYKKSLGGPESLQL